MRLSHTCPNHQRRHRHYKYNCLYFYFQSAIYSNYYNNIDYIYFPNYIRIYFRYYYINRPSGPSGRWHATNNNSLRRRCSNGGRPPPRGRSPRRRARGPIAGALLRRVHPLHAG